MTDTPLFLGIDAGTSGLRAICIDAEGEIVGSASHSAPQGDADALRRPSLWHRQLHHVLSDLTAKLDPSRIVALSIDGQSGSVLLCDAAGNVVGDRAMLYRDAPSASSIEQVLALTGTTSVPLARGLDLMDGPIKPAGLRLLHQADWLAGLMTGSFETSDHGNALKTGFQAATGKWKFSCQSLPPDLLPKVVPTGSTTGSARSGLAAQHGFSSDTQVIAGTTDGTAGFIAAAGLHMIAPGQAVTSLGTTLVLKLVTGQPITSDRHGLYSHYVLGSWIAGGASNSGAGVLRCFFSPAELRTLSRRIDANIPTGLEYYPLPAPGERFPVCDPDLAPRLTPRPSDDAEFLAGLFEGIARIERRGYEVIAEQGGVYPKRVLTVGGGAQNETWTAIRERILETDVTVAEQADAAYGSALIARHGARP